MNWSRFVAILSIIGAAATALAVYFEVAKPQWAFWLLAIATAINAITERVQGGKSKIELTADEAEIILIHREKERQRALERNA